MSIYKPYDYQAYGQQHIIRNPGAGLFLEMGLGKTVITLSAIEELIYDRCEVTKVLIIAPKKTAKFTWDAEAAKWDHLKHLRFAKVLGDEKQRKAALLSRADIYLINRENVSWLVSKYGMQFPFKMVVIDESSSFKDGSTARFKAMRIVRPLIKRVVILTGTPASESLVNLWSQMYLVDQGLRLGEKYGDFEQKYFERDPYSRKMSLRVDLNGSSQPYEDDIYSRISDVCISMKEKDYLQLPDLLIRDHLIPMPVDVMKKYRQFERELVLEISTEKAITAVNAAVLTGKLLQFANGAVYDKQKQVHPMHDEKLDSLEELVEANNGRPLIIAYYFQHDRDRIMKRLAHFAIRELKHQADVDDWNAGKIPVLLVHPASAGHGLNLQHGGNTLILFGLFWSLEMYQQIIKRLHRLGQTDKVIIYRMVMQGTMDEDVLDSWERKANQQESLMRATKAVISRHRKAA